MNRYFINLSFNGKNYHGWQTQPNAVCIQQILEQSLSLLLKHNVAVTGAGRTDTGVHARYFVAHFDSPTEPQKILSPHFTYQFNCILPNDIAVEKMIEVKPDAHARFSAISRTYQYYISISKNPFLNHDFAWFLSKPLQLSKMNEACQILLEYNDFTSFAKLHSDSFTNNCQIMQAKWKQQKNTLIFTIEANRFLRNMVRSIVGTLVQVGLGQINNEEFRNIIVSKNRSNAGYSVPAKGLYLTDIKYPPEIFIVSNI